MNGWLSRLYPILFLPFVNTNSLLINTDTFLIHVLHLVDAKINHISGISLHISIVD